jgi:hypothetical protein
MDIKAKPSIEIEGLKKIYLMQYKATAEILPMPQPVKNIIGLYSRIDEVKKYDPTDINEFLKKVKEGEWQKLPCCRTSQLAASSDIGIMIAF